MLQEGKKEGRKKGGGRGQEGGWRGRKGGIGSVGGKGKNPLKVHTLYHSIYSAI